MTGDDLRALRKSWGLTQQELADLVGWHVQRISEAERKAGAIPLHLSKALEYEGKLRAIKKILDDS